LRGPAHLGRVDDEQKNVRDIKRPAAFEHLDRGIDAPLGRDLAAEHECGGIAGQKDEYFGRVAKNKIGERQIRKRIVRHMVDKNKEQA
jgi:hypothetical protein